MNLSQIIKIVEEVISGYSSFEAGTPVTIGPYDVTLGGQNVALTLTIAKK